MKIIQSSQYVVVGLVLSLAWSTVPTYSQGLVAPDTAPSVDTTDPEPEPLPDPDLTLEGGTTFTLEDLNLPETFKVEAFRYQGSTIYSNARLDEITAISDLQNRELSLPELLQAVSKITNQYVEDGYLTTGAYLPLEENPPEALDTGIVTIQILEGSLEAINIQGLNRLRDRYIRSRLNRGAQAPLNQAELLDSLQLLQLDPLIESLSAELATGTRPGTSILNVEIREAPSFSLNLSTDNNRSPSVGSWRRSPGVSEGNLLGFGDRISVDYTNTEGSDKFEASYEIPLNAKDGTLSLRFSTSANRIIEEPFDSIDIRSPSKLYEISYRQPLILEPEEELALGLTTTHQESETTLLGIPFPELSSGADEAGQTQVSALRFFQDYRRQAEQSVLALRSQFSFGLDVLDANISTDGTPDSRFFAWRGQGQYVRLTAPDTLLLIRSDLQLADQHLLPLEQFGLGGQQTVRGYRQDALITDNGALLSVEYRYPLFRHDGSDGSQGILQLTPFLDAGIGWNASDNPEKPDDNTLIGAGLGLLWQQGDTLSIRVDYGIPITEGPSDRDRTWQENGLYFSIQLTPTF